MSTPLHFHVARRVGVALPLPACELHSADHLPSTGSGTQVATPGCSGISDSACRATSACWNRKRIPRNNVLFVGAIALIGAFLMTFQMAAELLNFGAFIAFMGVNAAAFWRYWLRAEQKKARLPLAARARIRHLFLHLAESRVASAGRWRDLAFGRGRIRRHQDPRFPTRPDQLRSAAGIVCGYQLPVASCRFLLRVTSCRARVTGRGLRVASPGTAGTTGHVATRNP